MSNFLRVAAAFTLWLASASAQDVRGRVQGVVTDQSQAVVVGANVTLVNDNTGIAAASQTSPNGQYLFDYVLPGNYTVSVEMQGFRKFVQKNVLVQARGDVTVNTTLETGSTMESITVEASPVAVNFNTSTMGMTLDTKMANNLPIIHRNPFLLVSLNPATVVRSSTEQSPFHHWAASQLDVGGNTSTKNDIILDGSPSMTSQKSSYTPPMDAVQEVNLQQNAVDAEFGHSAGGVLAVSMKSGTNEFHGSAYYLGRNPVFNAMADRVVRSKNLTRQNVWGGTLGGPIKKNKLFNFFSYEAWRTIEPRTAQNSLPTDAERNGDFSASRNADGALRTIFDPNSTRVDGQTVIRQPFAGNVLPQNRIDGTAKRMLNDVWKGNTPGTGPNQLNNFIAGFANRFRYWNASNRTDWNISERFKVFGRFNQFRTFTAQDDYTGGSIAQPVDGSKRHALSFSGDAVYTLNASTVINVRGAYNSIIDSFGVPSATMTEAGWEAFWPGNAWYKPYSGNWPDIYYPGVTVNQPGSSTVLGRGNYWFQEPKSFNIESKMSKNVGRHYFKVGGEYRRENTVAVRPVTARFVFGPETTANSFNQPNTRAGGDGWATFLLGALDGRSDARSIPLQKPQVDFTGFFVHDDFKITQRLTLNLGLRYEFFTSMRDPEDRLSRYLDLTNPIPEFQGANAPAMPAAVAALRAAAPVYNGAWVFTDSSNRGSWNAPKNIFLPRIGMAWRVDNNTAIRVGFARYVVPATLTDGLNILGSVPYPGFDATTTTLDLLQGVPRQTLANPYPTGLVPVVGKRLGRYNNMGDATTWYRQAFNPSVNDRINFSLQRQLPLKVLADVTFFINSGRNQPYTYNVNQIDPRIGFRVGNAVTQAVANPFFNLLPADKMPGRIRTQPQLQVSELLRPYPQYGDLNETLIGGRGNRYKALQMQFQRPFANGFNFVIGYNYNWESNEEFYDNQDFFTRTLTWQPAQNAKQRFTGAAIYELPFGKGRKYMGGVHPFVDAVLGGWSMSGLFTFNTGVPLRIGSYVVTGDPTISDPRSERWFDTSKFSLLPAFTRRANPWQYSGLVGPRFANIDLTLAKEFAIVKERLKFELRGEAYNVVNSFTADQPELNINSSNFGKLFRQRPGVFGRQIQFSGRFVF